MFLGLFHFNWTIFIIACIATWIYEDHKHK